MTHSVSTGKAHYDKNNNNSELFLTPCARQDAKNFVWMTF